MVGRFLVVALLASGAACAEASPPPIAPPDPSNPPNPVEPVVAERGPRRSPIRGLDFPAGVIALTWDDGPDRRTLDLARYLHEQGVSATFFVVGEWDADVSDEPGVGRDVYATGYARLPVLGELVALGHRLGTHTRNHALLTRSSREETAAQLRRGFEDIGPFLTNELRIFRAPGGAFDAESAAALTDPIFDDAIGPFHWDVDAKDWDDSIACRERPAAECEPGPVPGQRRVRPEVVARWYAESLERTNHGIVLLHDRVGDVGSSYALDVAKSLVPRLKKQGFATAAPVLAFSPRRKRDVALPRAEVTNGDINGDGLADRCTSGPNGVACALAVPSGFLTPTIWSSPVRGVLRLADVNGDGRADLCDVLPDTVECGLAP